MRLPDFRDFDLTGKKVLLRVDFDVPLIKKSQIWEVGDDTRIKNALPTINLLLTKSAKIILLAHLDRPEGKVVPELSLKPVSKLLTSLLHRNEVKQENGWGIGEDVFLRENLRFDPGEEKNSPLFAQKLASLGDFYVNDAFACSHRKHASIVGLPKLLPHAAGLDLLEEVRVLAKVLENPQRPVVVILGGAKEDKLETIGGLAIWADYILVGGKLPLIITNKEQFPISNKKIIIAGLSQSGKDINLETIEKFTKIIKKAGTIIWSGPMGQYETKEDEFGTRMIGEMVRESSGFKIIGGGDTEAALTKFGLIDKIDYVSSGGGAMLEFLANGDLPGLKALRE